ncbi:MAG: ATP-binding protein [Chlorobaculum sp.]|nr:ATP-binding protein [Chlorobaculum sp.]
MKLGTPATGADFFGRDQEMNDLWHYLESDHIRFPGVRRLGKTSILQRLADDAADHGLFAKWLDVSNIDTAQNFVTLLDQVFPENGIKRFLDDRAQQASRWFKRIQKIEVNAGGVGFGMEFSDDPAKMWQKAAYELYARLQSQPLLILLDEFPVMLEKLVQRNREEAGQLLAWLRIWRQSQGACRFVFTGSIGLQSLLERHGLGETMNDCYSYPLGAYSRKDARGLWRHFAPIADPKTSWQVEDAVIDHALSRVGWWSPYFLSLLLDESMRAARDRLEECPASATDEARIEVADVDDAYEKLLAERSRFHYWEQRLKKSLEPAELDFCLKLLTVLSRSSDGLTQRQLSSRLSRREPDPDRREQRLQELLVRLTDEGYTSPPDGDSRIQFLSFLLRDWWNRNHV